MTIEFHASVGASESLVQSLRSRITALYHLEPNIRRAEVYLHSSQEPNVTVQRCDIFLTIFRDNIFVSRRGATLEEACNSVLAELNTLLHARLRAKDQLPEVTVSTVKV